MVWPEGENVLRRKIVRVVFCFRLEANMMNVKCIWHDNFGGGLMHTPGMLSFDLFTDEQRVMSD